MALSFGLTKRILENFGVPFVFGGIVYAVTLYFTGWPQSAAITAAALTFLVVFGLSFAFTENRTASSLRAENKTLHTEVGNLGGNLATKDSELQKKGEEISALALRIKDGDEKIETGRVEAEALRRRSSELESQLEVAKSRETEFQKRESELLARIATAEAERAQTKAQAEANEKVLAGRISSLQGATKLPMPRVSVQGQKTGVFGFGPMEWTVILENAGDGPMKDIDVGIRIGTAADPSHPNGSADSRRHSTPVYLWRSKQGRGVPNEIAYLRDARHRDDLGRSDVLCRFDRPQLHQTNQPWSHLRTSSAEGFRHNLPIFDTLASLRHKAPSHSHLSSHCNRNGPRRWYLVCSHAYYNVSTLPDPPPPRMLSFCAAEPVSVRAMVYGQSLDRRYGRSCAAIPRL